MGNFSSPQLMKIIDFICAAQNDAAITKLWLQFPDSPSPLGKGGWESLASETRLTYACGHVYLCTLPWSFIRASCSILTWSTCFIKQELLIFKTGINGLRIRLWWITWISLILAISITDFRSISMFYTEAVITSRNILLFKDCSKRLIRLKWTLYIV